MSKKTLWNVCLAGAAALSVLTFTPLVIPPGEFRPMLGGIPLTLWTGIVIAFLFIALTYLAGRVHPEMERKPDKEEGR